MTTDFSDDDEDSTRKFAEQLGSTVVAVEAADKIIEMAMLLGTVEAIDDKSIDAAALIARFGGVSGLLDPPIEFKLSNALMGSLNARQMLALRDDPAAMVFVEQRVARVCADAAVKRTQRAETSVADNVHSLGEERLKRKDWT